MNDLTSKLALGGPWHGVIQVAQAALSMYAMFVPRTERYLWPKDTPTMEREVIQSCFGDRRTRIRRIGGQWMGWDNHSAPANFTLVVDHAGMSIYGTRCRLNANANVS